MARLVLSDASPLIGLSRVGGLDWLRALFGEVALTPEVRSELHAGPEIEGSISAALEDGWLTVLPDDAEGPRRPAQLGPGEWSCIRAGLAREGPVLLLLDDRLARREALLQGLRVTGIAAIVATAQRRGLIASAREVFEALLRSDFRISADVIREILVALNEEA